MSDKRDDDVSTEFDQTNGLAGDTTGDSDGTAEGEEHSAAERDDHAGVPGVTSPAATPNT